MTGGGEETGNKCVSVVLLSLHSAQQYCCVLVMLLPKARELSEYGRC